MILLQTAKEAVGYSHCYAATRYNMGGGGNLPRT